MSVKLLAGRYELIEKIGDGGMAIVYKARCRLLNRYVAIKILKPEYTKDVKVLDKKRITGCGKPFTPQHRKHI